MGNLDSRAIISNSYWQRAGLFILWLISLCFVALTIDQSLLKIGLCLAIFGIFSLWGHVVVYPIHYKNGRILEGFVWGTISGIALASLITSIIVYVTGWNLLVILGSVTVLPALLLSILIKRVGINSRLQPGQDLDLRILLLALVVVTLFFYFPFKNLGARVDDKYLYAWLFGHDFINRMVHVNSLSLGLPLESFFFSGEKLSYYWLAYVYPALIRNVTWMNLNLKQVLQVTQLFYSLLTTAGLAIFLNRFVHRRGLFIVLMALALCCYSYVGLLVLGWEGVRSIYGAISIHLLGYDLSGFSRFSHAFYRFFLVEPQATLGIATMLMILTFYDKKGTYYGFTILGLLLGLLFGVEATNGIMVILWFAGMTLLTVYINREERYSIFKKHLCALVCGGLIGLILFGIHMYSFQTGKGALTLSVNWFPVITGPFYFIVGYGPAFLFGIAGLYGITKKRESLDHFAYPYILLFGISLFFVFFIRNPTEPHFGLIKATRTIPVCLLAFAAYFFQSLRRGQKLRKVTIALILLALPSLFTDNFIASDISNPSTYVRCSDMEAANWIKSHLPGEAIIQAEPNYPGKQGGKNPIYFYSFIPIFSERRTAIGEWKVSMQEHSRVSEVAERFHSVKKIYSTANVDGSVEILRRYHIDYVYVGELERELYPGGVTKFMNSDHFQLIYLKGNVAIYKFKS